MTFHFVVQTFLKSKSDLILSFMKMSKKSKKRKKKTKQKVNRKRLLELFHFQKENTLIELISTLSAIMIMYLKLFLFSLFIFTSWFIRQTTRWPWVPNQFPAKCLPTSSTPQPPTSQPPTPFPRLPPLPQDLRHTSKSQNIHLYQTSHSRWICKWE